MKALLPYFATLVLSVSAASVIAETTKPVEDVAENEVLAEEMASDGEVVELEITREAVEEFRAGCTELAESEAIAEDSLTDWIEGCVGESIRAELDKFMASHSSNELEKMDSVVIEADGEEGDTESESGTTAPESVEMLPQEEAGIVIPKLQPENEGQALD